MNPFDDSWNAASDPSSVTDPALDASSGLHDPFASHDMMTPSITEDAFNHDALAADHSLFHTQYG